MADLGFPADDYTPHGYLANPYAVARSWSDGAGGCLRSSRDHVGFGWQLPWALRARAAVEVLVLLESDGSGNPVRLLHRADFAPCDLHSPHHSARLFVYCWRAFGRVWEARYTLIARGALGLELSWQADQGTERPASSGQRSASAQADHGSGVALPAVTVGLALVGTRQPDAERTPASRVAAVSPPGDELARSGGTSHVGALDLGAPFGRFALAADGGPWTRVPLPDWLASLLDAEPGSPAGSATRLAATDGDAGAAQTAVATAFVLADAPGGAIHALTRQLKAQDAAPPACASGPVDSDVSPAETRGTRRPPADRPLGRSTPDTGGDGADEAAGERSGGVTSIGEAVRRAVERARQDDTAFWAGAARLAGDWPASWRRGWVYDVETTRMCVFPPGGIFHDVWPAWMIQWPRAVVAEGTLDMARLAYASPELATRASLSLFRDATAPNVPCVFQHGEPNMVAADGSVCGTSPAWCLPFYNLERLYALTLDRAWLAEIAPLLGRYLDWWLAERTDPDGWAVYKCTWEAGEDDTPRLDPERRGDNVVSAFVRPVELQAALALSAGVLARFADVVGDAAGGERWRAVAAEYRERTRALWDGTVGRFRDWDARAGRFLAPAGEANYWGVDPCRYSALAFTPALAGLADEPYRSGLRRELPAYAGPPWTLWASWSYVVLEAALALGERGFAARVAHEIVARVYRELDTHEIAGPSHPTPGVAREYWPLGLSTWASCEGYGWGANTATLLVRQIFGFLEGPYDDDGPPLRFQLAPGLPPGLLTADREYRIENLPYRGAHLALGYRVAAPVERAPAPPTADTLVPAALTLLIGAGRPTRCRVTDADGAVLYEAAQPRTTHAAPGVNGGAFDVVLTPADRRRLPPPCSGRLCLTVADSASSPRASGSGLPVG